jgi:hypothetical protein
MNNDFEMEVPILKFHVQISITLCLKILALRNETWLLHRINAMLHISQTEQ